MKICEPNFYEKFKCKASECNFTCCRDWSIAVDDDTYKCWRKLGLRAVTKDFSGRVIKHGENGFCPYLTDDKLCGIVISKGDACIPKTCRDFPRSSADFSGVVEKYLSPQCEEVLRLLWEEKYLDIPGLDEKDIRYGFIHTIQDEEISMDEALRRIFMKVWEDFSKKTIPGSTADFSFEEKYMERRELFYDVLEEYSKADKYRELLTKLYDALEKPCPTSPVPLDFKWEKRLRLLLAYEIYTELGCESDDTWYPVMKLEWLIMEYALIRHLFYVIPEDEIPRNICLVFRLMGYGDEDIEEYLVNSFESPVWPLEYFDLLV